MIAGDRRITQMVARDLAVEADGTLLAQALNNLVGNAARYCPRGGWIEVSAQRCPRGIEVVVTNACLPIAATDRAHFFERFHRGDPARTRAIPGSGLGPSLAREIARAHDGDLTLEPSAPDAVRMRLQLPAR